VYQHPKPRSNDLGFCVLLSEIRFDPSTVSWGRLLCNQRFSSFPRLRKIQRSSGVLVRDDCVRTGSNPHLHFDISLYWWFTSPISERNDGTQTTSLNRRQRQGMRSVFSLSKKRIFSTTVLSWSTNSSQAKWSKVRSTNPALHWIGS